MKQGEKFIKGLMILLAAVVLSYFGYAAWRYFSAPPAAVTALAFEADVGAPVTGYVVREELPLSASQPIVVPTRAEGEHIGKGQTVAVAYRDSGAQQHQAEIANLQQQIAVLTCAVDSTVSAAALDTEISALLTSYTARTALQQSVKDDTAGTELKGLVMRSGADEETLSALQTERDALREQLDRLTSQTGSGAQALTAGQAGYFSGTADGYETVLTPQALETMTVSDLQALPARAQPVPDGTYGKLIVSDTWYFVTAVDEALTEGAEPGDSVQLRFTRDALQDITMRIERIGEAEDGMRLLVLSGSRFVRSVTLLRRQTCDLIFRSYSGLRVPKEAVRTDETGATGVYVLEGAVARWKQIEVCYETTENYVATLDVSSTDNLWPGDEILLGDGLYDGKVVYK